MFTLISSAEIDYICNGSNLGIRADGRSQNDFRGVCVECDVFPHVNGSSRVTVGNISDVVCSIKIEVAEPSKNCPDKGIVEVNCEVSPSCCLRLDDKRLQEETSLIAQHIQSIYDECNAINLDSLGIITGKFCWIVYIELLILQLDGSIVDACTLATYIALHTSKIPKVGLLEGESGHWEDFELSSGDVAEAVPLSVKSVPIGITVLKVGKSLLLDASALEEACATSGLTVFVDANGRCCGVRKIFGGKFSVSEVDQAMMMAATAAVDIFSKLNNILTITSQEDRMHPDAPPVRVGLLS